MPNSKNGISSYELHRALGVTQKTARFMLHRIRIAMTDITGKSTGNDPIEVDETFVSGKVINTHKGKRIKSNANGGNKVVVLGMLQRGGRVRPRSSLAAQSQPQLCHDREHRSRFKLMTDEISTYRLLETPYQRDVVNHAVEHVNGHIYTNGIENFWSLLKCGLRGPYINVEPAILMLM